MDIVRFMKYCRLPIFYKSQLRTMKVGDRFLMGVMKIADPDSGGKFVAEAWFEKHRGHYSFHATWTLPTNARRADVMVYGDFTLKTGGAIKFNADVSKETICSFAVVCRRIGLLIKRMPVAERRRWYASGVAPYLAGVLLDETNTTYRYCKVDDQISRLQFDDEYLPSHQLEAVIDKAMFLGAIAG